jgi:3-oxoadipate enol-lactonase
MLKLTTNDATIAYEVYGKGEPIIFIHGILVSGKSWEPQIDYFSKNHQVIVCDLRGHGESTATQDTYTVELFTKDIVALLDELNVERVICCGHSFGGMVAQELALSYPERVSALILVETVHGSWVFPTDAIMGATMRACIPIFMSVEDQINLFSRYFTMFGPSYGEVLSYIQQETVRHINDAINFENILQASFTFSSRLRLEQISCPTLVMVGQNFVQTHFHAYEMAWRIPNANLKTIPNAGHVLNWDDPETFNRFISEFLEERKTLVQIKP